MDIKNYQKLFNQYLDKFIHNIKNNKLREIIRYSLNDGKRLRPIIILDISYKLNGKYLYDLALLVELLHNASLIIDDLPSMDNDDYRREKLTVHKKYGERAAKITAYFLVFEVLKAPIAI